VLPFSQVIRFPSHGRFSLFDEGCGITVINLMCFCPLLPDFLFSVEDCLLVQIHLCDLTIQREVAGESSER